MAPSSRRALLRAASTTLLPLAVAGCATTTPDDPTTTATKSSPSTDSPTPSTTTTAPDYGPWSVIVANDADDAVTVTLELRTTDGTVHEDATVTVEPTDGVGALSVYETGVYTLHADTDFDSDSTEFNACKLNTDGLVKISENDGTRQLTVTQLHMDPGANNTMTDPYSCDASQARKGVQGPTG